MRWHHLTDVLLEMIRSMLCGRDVLLIYERVCRNWSLNSRRSGSWSSLNIDEWTNRDQNIPRNAWEMNVVERLLSPRLMSTSLRTLSFGFVAETTDISHLIVERWPRLRCLTIDFQPSNVDEVQRQAYGYDDDEDVGDSLTNLESLTSLTSLTIRVDSALTFAFPASSITHLVHLGIDYSSSAKHGVNPMRWSLPLLQSLKLYDFEDSRKTCLIDERKRDEDLKFGWCSKGLTQLDTNMP
jgi:hypothetical protein